MAGLAAPAAFHFAPPDIRLRSRSGHSPARAGPPFSDLLFPFVSLSVGLILFGGGLTLKLSQIREVHRSVRNLISIGAAITWVLGSGAAYWVLDLDLALSVLLGAILVVTGPTVVIPLLRHIRPVRRVASVAR